MSLSPPPASASTPSSSLPTHSTSPAPSSNRPKPTPTATPTPTTHSPPPFQYPAITTFPPFYTLQPTLSTRNSQLTSWTSLILAHATHTHTFLSSPKSPLFTNTTIHRSLPPSDALEILRHMVAQSAASWVNSLASGSASASGSGGRRKDRVGEGEGEVFLWWRSPEEWARIIGKWVEETGQKGTVLTFYELLEGEELGRRGREFLGLPVEMARFALKGWERRGWCVVIGESGVKFV
ncbi:MAG: hypothetical protein M1828_000407 [Chrysothrix sp. TS-e1954]|nr:MAG: hypothetical protein M1828_000407 [Chrysothrix sp. TS-e1954]